MSKRLKSQGKMATGQLIESRLAGAARDVQAAAGLELVPALARLLAARRAGPDGGGRSAARYPMPPCPTPFMVSGDPA